MFECLMVCLKCFDKTVGHDVAMVMMLRWILQGDDDTSADLQNPSSTCEEEATRDDLSEVGMEDGIERNEAIVTLLSLLLFI